MASMVNSFALLNGAEQAVAGAGKKKSKANKAKAKAPAAPAVDNTSVLLPVAHENAPAAQQQASRPAALSAPDAEAQAATAEREARDYKAVNDKARLWREWIRQASDKSNRATRYRASDGTFLDFKQVLLNSKALEISIEGCLVSGVPLDRDASLATLLSTVLPSRATSSSTALAGAISRLAGLVADDAPDTLGAAQRAVHQVVAALKATSDDGNEADHSSAAGQDISSKVLALDQQAAKQQAILVKLQAASSNIVSKEQALLGRQIYRLYEEKLDLLASGDVGVTTSSTASSKDGGTAAAASLRSLDDLKSVISNHLRAIEHVPKGKASADTTKHNLAAYRREESVLDQQAAEVAAQIRALDAQLCSLRSRAAEIEDKKTQIRQRQRIALDAQQSGSGRAGQSAMNASHYQDELMVAEALQEIVDPQRSKHTGSHQQQQAGVLDIEAAEAAPLEYVAHAHRYLDLTLSSLGEVPGKVAFAKQRLSQAQKLLALGAAGAAAQKEDTEKLLADTLRNAEELMASGVQVVGDVQRRYPVIVRLAAPAQQAAVSGQVQAVEAVLGQLRSAYDAVLTASSAAVLVPELSQARQRSANRGATAGVTSPAAVPVLPTKAAAPISTKPMLDEEAPPPHANGFAPTASVIVAPPETAKPRAPLPPPRSWAKVEQTIPAPLGEGEDVGLTPAEAFGSADTTAEVPKPALSGSRRNRRKV